MRRGSPRRPRRSLALLLLTAPLASVTSAQDWSEIQDLGVRARSRSPWPAGLTSGFAPLMVEVANDAEVPRTVSLVAEGPHWGLSYRSERTLRLGPGEERRLELSVPILGPPLFSSVDLRLVCGADDRWIDSGMSQLSSSIAFVSDPVLVLTAGDVAASHVAAWQTAVGYEVTQGGETGYDVEFAAARVGDDLPARVSSYSSLSAVVVDAHAVRPSEVPAAVLAWTRLGGRLAFLGPGAERCARETPGVAPWLEERFRVRGMEEGEGGLARVYRMGQGWVVVGGGEELVAEGDAEVLRAVLYAESRVPGTRGQPRWMRALAVPGLEDLPFRVFLVLLLGFTVLIGPVNFLVVRRIGRPALLLLTIPGLALLASVATLSYGILHQGIDLKEAEETYTVLDQRTHLADSLELRSFFAGLAPTDALRPGPGTICLPLAPDRHVGEREYVLQGGEEVLLSGEFLPVRRPGTQVVLSERAARGRLVVTRTGRGELRVENGLGASLEHLALKDAEGRLYTWSAPEGAPADVGASLVLTPPAGEPPRVQDWLTPPVDDRDLGWSLDQPEATYLAVLDANPFVDDTGLTPGRAEGAHVLLGVLPLDEEGWR